MIGTLAAITFRLRMKPPSTFFFALVKEIFSNKTLLIYLIFSLLWPELSKPKQLRIFGSALVTGKYLNIKKSQQEEIHILPLRVRSLSICQHRFDWFQTHWHLSQLCTLQDL